MDLLSLDAEEAGGLMPRDTSNLRLTLQSTSASAKEGVTASIGMMDIKRVGLMLLLVLLTMMARYMGVSDLLSLEALKEHHSVITVYADSSWSAVVIFLLLYASLMTFTIPGGTFVAVSAGVFFRQPLSTVLLVVGGVVGYAGAFLVAKSTLTQVLQSRAKSMYLYTKIRGMLNGNSPAATVVTLASFRLVPFIPCWINNVVPALLEVSLGQFVLGTLVGILPGSYFHAVAGAILGDTLRDGSADDLSSISAFLTKTCLSSRMIVPTALLVVWFLLLIIAKIKLQPPPLLEEPRRGALALVSNVLSSAVNLSLVGPTAIQGHSHKYD